MGPETVTDNFDSDLHAFITGHLAGVLQRELELHNVRPVMDDDRNFVPQIRFELRGAEFVLDVRQVG